MNEAGFKREKNTKSITIYRRREIVVSHDRQHSEGFIKAQNLDIGSVYTRDEKVRLHEVYSFR